MTSLPIDQIRSDLATASDPASILGVCLKWIEQKGIPLRILVREAGRCLPREELVALVADLDFDDALHEHATDLWWNADLETACTKCLTVPELDFVVAQETGATSPWQIDDPVKLTAYATKHLATCMRCQGLYARMIA